MQANQRLVCMSNCAVLWPCSQQNAELLPSAKQHKIADKTTTNRCCAPSTRGCTKLRRTLLPSLWECISMMLPLSLQEPKSCASPCCILSSFHGPEEIGTITHCRLKDFIWYVYLSFFPRIVCIFSFLVIVEYVLL